MIAMLQRPDKTNGRDAVDLIFRKLGNQKRGGCKKMINIESFVANGENGYYV